MQFWPPACSTLSSFKCKSNSVNRIDNNFCGLRRRKKLFPVEMRCSSGRLCEQLGSEQDYENVQLSNQFVIYRGNSRRCAGQKGCWHQYLDEPRLRSRAAEVQATFQNNVQPSFIYAPPPLRKEVKKSRNWRSSFPGTLLVFVSVEEPNLQELQPFRFVLTQMCVCVCVCVCRKEETL